MQSETAPASHPDFPSHLPLIHHNISFLLHRYGLDEERERLRHETGGEGPPFEWESGRPDWDGLIENAEAMEEDPAIDAEQNFEHPLVLRAEDLFHQLSERSEEEQWLPETVQAEHPLLELINATMCVGGKLAGALNGGLWPPELDHCACEGRGEDHLKRAV